MSNASDTRWLYRLEDKTFRFNRRAVERRSIRTLRSLALRVWKREAPNRSLPRIVAGRGTRTKGYTFQSFCEGFSYIELARHQRTILVLLHELTHALGPCVHGPKFVRLYFRLLREWAGYSKPFLDGVASGRGIYI
jgi:hypothetical protein